MPHSPPDIINRLLIEGRCRGQRETQLMLSCIVKMYGIHGCSRTTESCELLLFYKISLKSLCICDWASMLHHTNLCRMTLSKNLTVDYLLTWSLYLGGWAKGGRVGCWRFDPRHPQWRSVLEQEPQVDPDGQASALHGSSAAIDVKWVNKRQIVKRFVR